MVGKEYFLSAIAEDEKNLELARIDKLDDETLKKMDVCSSCGKVFGMSKRGNFICSDCYFEKIGEGLDDHPITALRIVRMK